MPNLTINVKYQFYENIGWYQADIVIVEYLKPTLIAWTGCLLLLVTKCVESHNNFLKAHKCPWENVSVYVQWRWTYYLARTIPKWTCKVWEGKRINYEILSMNVSAKITFNVLVRIIWNIWLHEACISICIRFATDVINCLAINYMIEIITSHYFGNDLYISKTLNI